MTQVQVTYDERRIWGRNGYSQHRTYKNRPFEEVIVYGPADSTGSRKSRRLWYLVDSGADHLQVNRSVAKSVAINLSLGHPQNVRLASGGTSPVTKVAGVTVGIEGRSWTVECLFGSNQTPILGREVILKVMDIGFDVNGWLLRL
jgi:predicted aspartyl protease